MSEQNGPRAGGLRRAVLLGPPGSGKGTQAMLLAERLGLRYIGTGVALREAIAQGSPVGLIAQPLLAQGQLVPDDVVNSLIEEMFRGPDRPERFVTDGYPRTLPQAEAFDRLLTGLNLPLDTVIDLTIDEAEVLKRFGGRRVCPNPDCGASFNVYSRPPKQAGVCDVCGTALVQRPDDREETIRERLRVFHESTEGLIDFYRAKGLLRQVSAHDPVEAIYRHVLEGANQAPGGDETA